MTTNSFSVRTKRVLGSLGIASLACLLFGTTYVYAGGNLFGPSIGGVTIDAKGAIVDRREATREQIRGLRDRLAAEVPEGMRDGIQLRKVSLRAMQEAIAQARDAGERVPPEIRYLAGIQRIQYVFVYPEANDIVLAGPGEAWRIDDLGAAVGTTTGMPVVYLQDLQTALRTAFEAEPQVISCSIDPTAEGVQRMRSYLKSLTANGPIRNPAKITARKHEIEESLGPQTVTLQGIDSTSRFAWSLVAADYRMKRLAMGLDEAPIKNMPSFLKLMGTRHSKNMMPRWWMEDSYDAILTDGNGLSWEIRGQGVKVLTEDELVADDGTRINTDKVNPFAKRWADTMTERYDELCVADPVFGQLRNCMDLAVLSALIQSEGLHTKAGLDLELLLDANTLALPTRATPRTAPSKVSFLVKGRHLAITASGGVQLNPWKVVRNREASDELASNRNAAAAPIGAKFFWD